jgi:hypothetical protein
MVFTRFFARLGVICGTIVLVNTVGSSAQSVKPTPNLDLESKAARQNLSEDRVQGISLDNLQELSDRFPPRFVRFAARSLSLRSGSGFTDAYESAGKLFVVTNYSPHMGYNDYHLAQVGVDGLVTIPLSKKRLVSLDAEVKTSEAMVLSGVTSDGSSSKWIVSSGGVRQVRGDSEVEVRREDQIYTASSRCTGPASGKLLAPLLIREGNTGNTSRSIPLRLLASATGGVSQQSSVKVFCRYFPTGSLLWLTNDDFGVTLVYAANHLLPLYDQAPQFATVII